MKMHTPEKEDTQKSNRAALFPVLSEGSKEKRAVSILLACMEQVPELARTLLQGQGAPFGKRSRLRAWTEAGPVGKRGSVRPDGRIEIESSRGQKWTALLEAKIGKADLDISQIEAYLKEGRAAGADAVITISNDFAVLANHHPTYRGKIPKGMTLLHWSWISILTKCRLLTHGDEIEDRDHRWIIEHLERFLGDPSTGVARFDRMPAAWKEVTEAVAATGAGVKKTSEAALTVAAGWLQESRDLGLQLTRLVHQPVSIKLNRAERDDPELLIKRVVESLCNDGRLEVEYLIPDSVSSLKVRADLKSRMLTSSMTIGAPEDRKTAKARVIWLRRQLKETNEDGIHINALFGRREWILKSLAAVREDPAFAKDDSKICPSRFEVMLISDLGRRMNGPRTMVQELEKHVPKFYKEVGQNLRAWMPSAPKVPAQQEKENDGGTETATAQPEGAGTQGTGMDEHQPRPGSTGDSPHRSDTGNIAG